MPQTSEKDIIEKEQGKEAKEASSEIIYKIEVPANRYCCKSSKQTAWRWPFKRRV